MGPLPIGSASVIQTFAGLSYHMVSAGLLVVVGSDAAWEAVVLSAD